MFLQLIILLFLLPLSHIAFSQSIVNYLPGFPGKLPFKLETGYIGVGESDVVQLFYTFVESQSNPQEDPLLLWLSGGPGCSGFSPFLYEIGPLSFNYKKSTVKPSLELNLDSWTKVASIIFLDAPAGAGFSYATTWKEYYSSDTIQGVTNYQFLRKWLLAHQTFLSNRLYVAGDSYSGKIVPLVAEKIANDNDAGTEPLMNLVGYVLGNPVTDEARDLNYRLEYAFSKALISEKLYESAKRNCEGNYTYAAPNNTACENDLEAFSELTERIFDQQILEPFCGYNWSPKPFTEENTIDFLFPQPWCRMYNYFPSYVWLNDKNVQKALNIREGTVQNWERCNRSLRYTKDLTSSYEFHQNLMARGYKALIYSGDQDMSIPHMATLSWIESLNLTTDFDWQPWFVDGQVAGYWLQWSDFKYTMSFATVKGGGHTAPEYKPKECYNMIVRWLSFFPL